jgi:hypothetical protein
MSLVRLIQADVEEALQVLPPVHCCFLDPPDNIGLGYSTYKDEVPEAQYVAFLHRVLHLAMLKSDVVWMSYNSRWTFEVGRSVCDLLKAHLLWEAKPCVQTFSFGQHNKNDLGNNHRPIVRLMRNGTTLYPDTIRVPSWRLENGDKRADPRGRVPSDVFDFTRVVGNSKQRRPWHPTQLNEGLVERCLKLCCGPDDVVLDLFSGTGTTLRVARRLELPVISVELDPRYCEQIAADNGLEEVSQAFPWERSWYGY